MEKEEKENLLETTETPMSPAKKNEQFMHLFLVVSISLNIFLTLFSIFALNHRQDLITKESYENGFVSDLGKYIQNCTSKHIFTLELTLPLEPIKSEIELVMKAFSGGVEIDSTGNFVTDQGGHEYVGPPGTAVDDAWNVLLGGQSSQSEFSKRKLKNYLQLLRTKS